MTSTTAAVQELGIASPRQKRRPLLALVRLARNKPIGAAAGLFCITLILVAVFAGEIAPHPAEKPGFPRLHAPSWSYPLGTDNLFRDQYSRILVGSRISLGIGFGAVFLGTVMGTTLGLVSGYFGGWVDLLVSRLMDVVLGFPPLVLAIFFLAIFNTEKGYGLKPFFLVCLAIAVIITPTTARIVRGSVLSVRAQQYIEAAVATGNGSGRIMLRHVLPNVFAPIIVIASVQIGNAILAEAALSFLGLGIATDSHPSWGKMLQDTRGWWQAAWWTAVMPGAAISLAVLSFNLFGDALRDVLDPRLRQSS